MDDHTYADARRLRGTNTNANRNGSSTISQCLSVT
jgi:hypothetical protein